MGYLTNRTKDFSVEDGLAKAEEQRKFYAEQITDSEKKTEFNKAVQSMIAKAKPNAKSGYDIPRGVSIESLYWKIGLGKTEEEYGEYLRSMD